MNEEQKIFPYQDHSSSTFIETEKVIWWAKLIIYLSAALQVCELGLNIMRLVLSGRYMAHNLPKHAHETLFTGCIGLLFFAVHIWVLSLAFLSLNRLNKFYRDKMRETLMRALFTLKRYYLATAIVLVLDIFWCAYYFPYYIKLIQQYPL